MSFSEPAPRSRRRPHIMVIDDEADLRMTLKLLLEQEGFRVTLAEDGAQALRQLREAVPDLLIVDLKMPHVDGWEFIRRLRAEPAWAHLPAILSSGTLSAGASGAPGFDATVRKCAPVQEMFAAVHALLARPRVHRNGA